MTECTICGREANRHLKDLDIWLCSKECKEIAFTAISRGQKV